MIRTDDLRIVQTQPLITPAVLCEELPHSDEGAVLDLEEAIGRLPAGARQVLVLVGLYGHSHEEAAAMLGVAVGTCKSQLHRARQLLGEQLAAQEGAP